MVNKKHLLTSKQMASFVNEGYLRFDKIIPKKLCDEASEELNKNPNHKWWLTNGKPFSEIWPNNVIGKVFRLPKVEGIIQSLVGPNPRYDHHFPHRVEPGKLEAQHWHADSIIDTRTEHFDIQLFFFPQDTPREMGGTLILPGSHFRKVQESEISRYHNIVGQLPIVCKAGTLFVTHHNIWHCAQPNRSRKLRFMFKLRLNPTIRQINLWNTDDLNDPEIEEILMKSHPWMGVEARIEQVLRIKLWRFLTDNRHFDSRYWLTRIENKPTTIFDYQHSGVYENKGKLN